MQQLYKAALLFACSCVNQLLTELRNFVFIFHVCTRHRNLTWIFHLFLFGGTDYQGILYLLINSRRSPHRSQSAFGESSFFLFLLTGISAVTCPLPTWEKFHHLFDCLCLWPHWLPLIWPQIILLKLHFSTAFSVPLIVVHASIS